MSTSIAVPSDSKDPRQLPKTFAQAVSGQKTWAEAVSGKKTWAQAVSGRRTPAQAVTGEKTFAQAVISQSCPNPIKARVPRETCAFDSSPNDGSDSGHIASIEETFRHLHETVVQAATGRNTFAARHSFRRCATCGIWSKRPDSSQDDPGSAHEQWCVSKKLRAHQALSLAPEQKAPSESMERRKVRSKPRFACAKDVLAFAASFQSSRQSHKTKGSKEPLGKKSLGVAMTPSPLRTEIKFELVGCEMVVVGMTK